MGWTFDRHLFTRRKIIIFSAAASLVLASLIRPGVWKHAEPFVNRYVVREDCQFCHAGDAICSRWGYDAVSRSRCYVGSARALDGFVARLQPGADLTVGVIGGSISACHDVELSECYHSLLARELERQHGLTVTVHNGGLGAVGSQFFAACWNLMLTGEEDLIILELAVNDPPYQLINKSMAYLILTLLSLPKRPALLLLDLYSPNYDFWYDAGVSTNTLAQFYDLPVISHRNVVYNYRHKFPDQVSRWWVKNNNFPRGHHPTPEGHALISDLTLSLLRERGCMLRHPIERPQGAWEADSFRGIPQWMPWHNINETIDSSSIMPEAMCQSAGAGPFELKLHPATVGFELATWNSKSYLKGTKVGDVAVFEEVVRNEIVRLFYWRSKTLGFGVGRCWANDDTTVHRHFHGYWDDPINGPAEGILFLTKADIGKRTKISCMIVDFPQAEGAPPGHEFRIAAIAW